MRTWRKSATFALLLAEAVAFPQHLPSQTALNQVYLNETLIRTEGEITYATCFENVIVCSRTSFEPVVRSGTNLLQIVNVSRAFPICIDCLCYHPETQVAVLGNLPLGRYVLTVALRESSFFPPRLALTNVSFYVRPSGPTLRISTTNWFGEDFLSIAVAGVPGPTYRLEKSANLANWMTVYSQAGAPFTYFEPAAADAKASFYRVSISPNPDENYPSW